MKRIINGKMYDTNTATLIAEYSYSNTRDFRHFHEELYQKKTGEFFLYGYGGCMSSYSVPCGSNNWSGSENIRPLTETEVKEWLCDYDIDTEVYISLFGEPEE